MFSIAELFAQQQAHEISLAHLRESSINTQFDYMITETIAEIDRLKKLITVKKLEETAAKKQRVKPTQLKVKITSPIHNRTPIQITNVQRTLFRREIEDDLQNARRQHVYQTDTIQRLQNNEQPFKVKQLIATAIIKQEALLKKIDELTQKIKDIEEGLFDDEISEKMAQNRKEAEIKGRAKLSKQKQKTPEKPTKRQYFDSNMPSKKQMEYEYARYTNNMAKFPPKLFEQLKTMANNRGFLFRGSSYYGALPAISPSNISIISERIDLGNGRFEIHKHEFGPTYYKVYTEYRGKRTILSSESRQAVTFNFDCISDYVK